MIVDDNRNAFRYRGLSPAFDRAFDYVSSFDPDTLAPGKTVIDGDRVFLLLSEMVYDRTQPQYESHARYADIQLVISGRERMILGTGGEEPLIDPEKDVGFCAAEPMCDLTLSGGQFVIFFPGEKHAPGIRAVSGPVRKAVVKVLCE